MAGRRPLWLLSLPLAAGGWLAAHCLAYTLVAPHDHHGGLTAAPILIACAVTVLLAVAIHDGVRRTAPAQLPAWPVALVPPLGFAVQEHVERLIEHNALPLGTVLEPVFLVGMALQLPVALAVLALARGVLAIGHAFGRHLGVPQAPRPLSFPAPPPLPAPTSPELARPPVLATGHGGRAPPAPAIT
jgi:hypothetical protein